MFFSKRRALTRQQREIVESAAQYPQFPFDKGKYSISCEYESNANTPGRQFNSGDRCPYTENEYAYVWDNNMPPPSTQGKSRKPSESHTVDSASAVAMSPGKHVQEVPTYEPTKVRRKGLGDHVVPQFYDVDPELPFKVPGVHLPPGFSQQQGQSGEAEDMHVGEFGNRDRAHKHMARMDRH